MDHLHTNTGLFKAQDIADALKELEDKQLQESLDANLAVSEDGFGAIFRKLFRQAAGKNALLFALLGGSLVNTLALGIVDVVAISGFVGDVGLQSLPWLWTGELLLSLMISGALLQVIDSVPRVKMMRMMLAALTVTYAVLAGLFLLRVSTGILYPMMYLIYAQQAALFPMAFWNLANRVYTLAEARKFFPLLSSGELLGRLVAYSLFTLTGLLGYAEIGQKIVRNPAWLMGISALLFLLGLLIFPRMNSMQKSIKSKMKMRFGENIRDSVATIREVPFFRNMSLLVALMWMALTILLFNFYASVSETAARGLHFETVYSIYNIAVLLLPLFLQWTVSDRLLERISPEVGYLFLPITLLVSMGMVFFLPHFLGGIGALFIAMIVYRGWYMPLYQSLYKLVPQQRRGRVRGLLGNISYTLGSLTGALLVGGTVFILAQLDANQPLARTVYLLAALGATLAAIYIGFRIRATYEDSLFSWRVARRARSSDVLDKLA